MRLAFHWALLPACTVTLLTGCEANQLYLASHTVVGINAAVNPEQTNGWLILGYDRSFATVIPRSVQTSAADGTRTREAMSALACSSLSVKGITIKRYRAPRRIRRIAPRLPRCQPSSASGLFGRAFRCLRVASPLPPARPARCRQAPPVTRPSFAPRPRGDGSCTRGSEARS